MALTDWTFDIRRKTEGTYSSSGSYGKGESRQSTQSIKIKYLVEAIPPDGKAAQGTGGDNAPEKMNEHYVGCITSLPRVMGSVYYDPDTELLNPYAICMSKDVTRNAQNPYLYEVSCTFKTRALETENCTVLRSSVSTPTDISPEVTVQVNGTQRVLYQDLYSGDQCYMYEGIKERFASPVTTDIPNLTLSISQYEASVTYAQILARSYTVNSATYAGYGAGMWLCKVANVSEVDIQTSAGSVTWARVNYEVTLSQDGFYDQGGTWTLTGHKHQVPLIASKYRDETDADKVIYFKHAKTSAPHMGMIDPDGTKASNQDKPQYLTFNRYRAVPFTFLQV